MTPQDLKQIANLIDIKFDKRFGELDKKLDIKFDKRFEEQDKKFVKIFDEKFKEQGNNLDKRFRKHTKLVIDLINTKLDNHLAKIDQKNLLWKSEIMDSVDSFGSEIRDSRESRLIGGHQTVSNTDRIERLEKKVFGAVTSA